MREVLEAKLRLDDPTVTNREVAQSFSISRATLYNKIARFDAPAGERSACVYPRKHECPPGKQGQWGPLQRPAL
jgi:hypothetical protein